jgi:hypothetical protein
VCNSLPARVDPVYDRLAVALTGLLAHVAGLPLEETLVAAVPFMALGLGLAAASLRDALLRRRRR